MEQRNLPRSLMLGVAILQGLLLFALYKATDLNAWPSQNPLWALPLWTAATVTPLLFLLAVEQGIERRALAAVFARHQVAEWTAYALDAARRGLTS